MEDESWGQVRRRLRYEVGGRTLCSIWFDALELKTHVALLDTGLERRVETAARRARPDQVFLLPSHPIADELPAVSRSGDRIYYTQSIHSHYLIRLEGAFDSYLKALPPKHRHEATRKVRRFAEVAGGTIDFRRYSSADEVLAFYPLARAVSAVTYQERVVDVGLPSDPTYVSELLAAAGEDRVRAYLLFLAGEPIAYGLCVGEGDLLNFLYTGYEPGSAAHAPGNVLLYHMLGDIFEDGRFRVMSLGSGEAQYKRSFATDRLRCATVYGFPRGVRYAALVSTHRLFGRASSLSGQILDRLGLKRRVRRLLRALGSPGRRATRVRCSGPPQEPASSSGSEPPDGS